MKMRNLKKIAVTMFVFTVVLCASALGGTSYVDAAATGNNDGSSWIDAYTDLQDGLANANAGDVILVAQGVYTPGENREDTFQLKNGVTIKGGYIGNTSSSTCCLSVNPDEQQTNKKPCCSCDPRDEQDICCPQEECVGETILSGDIGVEGDPQDNSYHVVTASGTDATAVLENVKITGGNANGVNPHHKGGGMYSDNGSATLRYVTFADNSAFNAGGAMYNQRFSSPTLTSCTFCNNRVTLWGGAICNYAFSSPQLDNFVLRDNSALAGGGLCSFDNSDSAVSQCTFYSNEARLLGGAIFINSSSPTIYNSIIWANTAQLGPQIGVIANDQRARIGYCDLEGGISNVFFLDNATVIWEYRNGLPTIMNVDPVFVDPANCDLRLRTTSPCLAASNNAYVGAGITEDRDGNRRFIEIAAASPAEPFGVGVDPIADLGGYERPPVIFVDDDAAGEADGSSWTDA